MTTEFVSGAPSRTPADNDSMLGLLRLWKAKVQQQWDDMLPARVMAYDRASNRAQVQPLIAMVSTNNTVVQRAQIAAVPVLQLGGGGFVLSFPLQNGDLGWIKANDRDISLFLQNYRSSPPNTQRMHSFSDAVFIPDVMMRAVTIADEDAGNAVFQSTDGTVKISLWDSLIKILAPQGVGINGTPSANAILDLQSTTQAFKPPRMTTAQRNAIPKEEGMVIWNTDAKALQTCNGTSWS